MKLILLLSIFSAVIASFPCGTRISKASTSSRYRRFIIGGTNVTLPSKWPWQVSVANGENCGGTIISERWVLTAAHCVESGDASNVTVLAGVTQDDAIYNGVQIKVVEVRNHPDYNGTTLVNDPSQPIPDDGQAVATGYGKANVAGTNELVLDLQFREVVVPIISPEVCKERWVSGNDPNESDADRVALAEYWSNMNVICASSLAHGISNGDSGGPLMMKASDGRWVQIGITSFKRDDADAYAFPNAFTDVRKYCDWIKETTGGEASCQDEEVALEDVEIKP